ncbi:hypothetical protein R3W88_025752 [Solanum pinnatisectum]|uniref:Uncharacterized protein n=1 Tax=Solanum pinnatisectum TaxID=50273 RepID=A0AAV9M6C8_9SOLN|nr:hypothetical protein R3W88_025752 [Solanum pinnatisectum]
MDCPTNIPNLSIDIVYSILLELPVKTIQNYPLYGFAYDFVAEDYKVLCVVIQLPCNTMYLRYIVEIYSVKNQSWKTIQDIFPLPSDFSLYVNDDPVSLNGVSTAMKKLLLPSKCGTLMKLCVWGDRVCVMTIINEEISIWPLEKDGKISFCSLTIWGSS